MTDAARVAREIFAAWEACDCERCNGFQRWGCLEDRTAAALTAAQEAGRTEVIGYVQRHYQPPGSPIPGGWQLLINWIIGEQREAGRREERERCVQIVQECYERRLFDEWMGSNGVNHAPSIEKIAAALRAEPRDA